MALSKPVNEVLGKVEWNRDINIKIPTTNIMKVCRISYDKAISVEVIHHLLGGPNMDYNCVMEVENSVDCFNFCKNNLLEYVTNSKKEIMLLEDCQSSTYNILVVILKQERTKTKREHIIVNAVVRLTISSTPKVSFARYITVTGN